MGGLPTGRAVGFIVNDSALAQGTGNPGALLWLKQGRLGSAVLAFVLEAGKIVAAMQVAWILTLAYPPLLLAGVAAVIAHGYSPFSRFRACRTFSVYLGFAWAASVLSGMLFSVLWVAVFALTRRQYRANLVVLLLYPLGFYLFRGYEAGFAGVVLLGYGLWHYRRGLWQTFRRTDIPWPKHAMMKALKEHRL